MESQQQYKLPIIHWLQVVISLALLCQIAISYPLWLTSFRDFPLLPLFEWLPLSLNHWGNYISLALLVGLLISVLFKKSHPLLRPALLFTLLFFFLQDELRLQAWSYQYFLMLGVITFSPSKSITITSLQFILIGTYWWSGLQKFNIHFVTNVYPWLCHAFEATAFLAKYKSLGYGIPIFETVLGLGLALPRLRKIAAYGAILFHCLILMMLSPLGHDWNQVVIPWNIAMIIFLYVLFIYKAPTVEFKLFIKNTIGYVLIFLVGIAPLFNFFGYWKAQLSFTMYSGVSSEIVLYYNPDNKAPCIPQAIQQKVGDFASYKALYLDQWAVSTLKVPVYGTPKIARQLKAKWCDCLGEDTMLNLQEHQRLDMDKTKATIFECASD